MPLSAADLQLLRQLLVEAELPAASDHPEEPKGAITRVGGWLYVELVRSYQKLRADITAGPERHDMHGVLRETLLLMSKERDYQDSGGKAPGR